MKMDNLKFNTDKVNPLFPMASLPSHFILGVYI